MPQFSGLGAVAIRFTSLAEAISQTSRSQIAKPGNLGLDPFTLNHQFGHGWIGHGNESLN